MKTKTRFASLKKRTNDRLLTLSLRLTGLGLNVVNYLAPKLSVEWGYTLFGKTHRYAPQKPELAWREKAHHHTLWQGGKKLSVLSWGHGPSILLVHGWNGRGTQLTPFIAPLLERGYQVIAMDALSHGLSEGNHTNLFHFSESVRTVGTAFGPLSGVLAHSMGGAATTLAIDSGMEANRLVFIAPPVNPINWVHQFSKTLGLSRRMVQHFHHYLAERFGRRWQQVQTFELQSKMQNKLLIFHDTEDREVPFQASQEQVKYWNDSQLILTQGLGHFRILQDPKVIAHSIKFLTDPGLEASRSEPSKGGYFHEKTNEENIQTIQSPMDSLIPA